MPLELSKSPRGAVGGGHISVREFLARWQEGGWGAGERAENSEQRAERKSMPGRERKSEDSERRDDRIDIRNERYGRE